MELEEQTAARAAQSGLARDVAMEVEGDESTAARVAKTGLARDVAREVERDESNAVIGARKAYAAAAMLEAEKDEGRAAAEAAAEVRNAAVREVEHEEDYAAAVMALAEARAAIARVTQGSQAGGATPLSATLGALRVKERAAADRLDRIRASAASPHPVLQASASSAASAFKRPITRAAAPNAAQVYAAPRAAPAQVHAASSPTARVAVGSAAVSRPGAAASHAAPAAGPAARNDHQDRYAVADALASLSRDQHTRPISAASAATSGSASSPTWWSKPTPTATQPKAPAAVPAVPARPAWHDQPEWAKHSISGSFSSEAEGLKHGAQGAKMAQARGQLPPSWREKVPASVAASSPHGKPPLSTSEWKGLSPIGRSGKG